MASSPHQQTTTCCRRRLEDFPNIDRYTCNYINRCVPGAVLKVIKYPRFAQYVLGEEEKDMTFLSISYFIDRFHGAAHFYPRCIANPLINAIGCCYSKIFISYFF